MITPYKQAYVVTLKSGRAVLAVIEATDSNEGERAARVAAVALEPDAEFWAIAAYPTTADLPLGAHEMGLPPGVYHDGQKPADAISDAPTGGAWHIGPGWNTIRPDLTSAKRRNGGFIIAQMFGPDRRANASLFLRSREMLAALAKAESFISGFEGDEMQEGVAALLTEVRGAISADN